LFRAVGDWGGVPDPPFATPREVATAATMGRTATDLGADFVLALGDNFYYQGVRDEWDPRFQETFEQVFTAPGLRELPWFVLAGNHDHAGNVTAQLAYSHHSPRWHFPHYYYSLRLSLPGTNASARLLVLDTVLLCGGADDFGAGGAPRGPRDAGAAAAQLPAPASLCGHDHNLQFLEEGGVGYVVSGAGNFMEASQQHAGAVPPGSLRFFFGAPASPGGFAHLRLDAHAATITFLEATGRVLYRVALPPRNL
ncbi:PREDICTED: tartrate-resistant acid phosphatase type 5, partial [Nipponia nippon]|uniref:tartrate-resistant acid phosphatase type 5 n=1 Tax=Nipponia nippon TaxID=128390 RepID=UPI00051152C3